MFAAVMNDPLSLRYASEELKADADVATAAVSCDGLALSCAHEYIQDNYLVALRAVTRDPDAFQFVSEELRYNLSIVMAAINADGMLLCKVPCNMKSLEVVLAAVGNNGRALLYAPDEFKGNKHVVSAAVRNRGSALLYATEDLKRDKQIVLLALMPDDNKYHDNDPIIDVIPWDMRKDKEIALAAVKRARMLYFLPECTRNDLDVVLAAAAHDIDALDYAPIGFCSEKPSVLALVASNGEALRVVDERFSDDIDVVKAAVRNNGMALEWASYELRNCEEVVIEAVKNSRLAVQYAGKRALRALVEKQCLQVQVDTANWPNKRLRTPSPSE